MLPLLLAASFAIGPLHWSLPEKWEAQTPPADSGIEYIFQPLPEYRDGQNISVSHDPRDGMSLFELTTNAAEAEQQDGRTINRVVQHPTCGGKLPGMEIEAKYGELVSQLYHITVYKDRAYMFIYTYAPRAQVDPRVRKALDSICR